MQADLPTQKVQLQEFFQTLGATDYPTATAALSQLQGWQTQRQSLFAALGGAGDVPADFDFSTAINGLVTTQNEICATLGAPDIGAARTRLTEVVAQANHWTAIAADLGTAEKPVTDLQGATAAISGLRDSVKDFDDRVSKEVINRAASAGVATPLPKVPENNQQPGAKTMSRGDFNALPSGQRMEFVKTGGKLTD